MTCIDDLSDRPREGSEGPAVTATHNGRPTNAGAVRERVVDELRRLLPRMSEAAGAPRALFFGIEELDARLHGGGLTFGALHEIVPANPGDMAAAFGFAMALLGSLPQRDMAFCVTS